MYDAMLGMKRIGHTSFVTTNRMLGCKTLSSAVRATQRTEPTRDVRLLQNCVM